MATIANNKLTNTKEPKKAINTLKIQAENAVVSYS